MGFNDLMAAEGASFFGELADAAEYIQIVGDRKTTINTLVIVGDGNSMLDQEDVGTVLEDTNTFEVPTDASAIPAGSSAAAVSSPTHKDRIVLNGETWEVVTVLSIIGNIAKLAVRRPRVTERTTQGFRTR